MKNLLLICKNSNILDTLCRVLSKQATYNVTPASTCEEIYLHLYRSHFDGVLLGSGLSETEEEDVRSWINQNTPKTRVIVHYGGGSGLLFNELNMAFTES